MISVILMMVARMVVWLAPIIDRNLAYVAASKILVAHIDVENIVKLEVWSVLAKRINVRDAGTLAYHLGLLDQAIVCYRSELQATNDPIARLMLGKILLEDGRREEALVTWQPLDPTTLNALGKYYMTIAEQEANRSNWLAALNSAELALHLEPQLARAEYIRGLALVGLNKPTLALAAFRKALSFNPDANTKVAVSLALSDALIVAGKASDAIEILVAVRNEWPEDVRARIYLARVYEAAGRLGDAEVEYKAAVALDTQRTETYLEVGDFYSQQGNWAAAQQYYESIQEISPTSGLGELALGQLALRRGDSDLAITYLEKADRLASSDNFIVLAELGRAYKLSGRLNEAVVAYQQAAALTKGSTSAIWVWEEYADLLLSQGEDGAAEDVWREILKLDPDNDRAALILEHKPSICPVFHINNAPESRE